MLRRHWLLLGCSSVASLLATWSEPAANAATAKVTLAIIMQKASAVDELSIRELKRLYLGEHLGAPDGKKLLPLNQAVNSPDRVDFERLVLGMAPDEAARFWIDRRIRGQHGAPKSIPSVELLRRVVAVLPGAIGYVKGADPGTDLKVIKIDGKSPGEPGYPLEY